MKQCRMSWCAADVQPSNESFAYEKLHRNEREENMHGFTFVVVVKANATRVMIESKRVMERYSSLSESIAKEEIISLYTA